MPSSRLLAILAVLAAAPVFAQNPDVIDKEAQKPAQATASQKAAADAAASAAGPFVAGADVTYDQVLASPDDVDLNYRYALTQVRQGNLKGASATLERILLVNPSLETVRLMYGIVLLRLDNLSESERELKDVLTHTGSADIKKQGAPFLAEVLRRQKRTQVSGRVGLGFEYDDNRNNAPSTGQRLVNDTPIQLDPGSLRRDDTSILFLGNLEAHHDLGTAAGHEVFGTFNYYRAEQNLVKTLNLAAYSFTAGGTYKSSLVNVTPSIVFDHVTLAQTTFMRDHGFDLRFDRQFGRKFDAWFDFHDVRQVFSQTDVVPQATDRTGIEVDSTLGGDYNLNPVQRVGASLLYGVKHAQNNAFSYYRRGIGLTDTWLTGRGTFLMSNAGLYVDNYWRPDPNVSAGDRRDTTIAAGATFGAPLSLFTPKLADLICTLSYQYLGITSTIRNYSYTNNKIAALMTYKFAAGF